jgi:hypothetical protein
LLSQDAEVGRLRGLMPAQDELVPLPADQLLVGLLESHPANRMAAEYLISYQLLTKDLESLARSLSAWDSLGAGERPPLYDEAALLVRRRKSASQNLVARLPRPETQKRFERFVELAKAGKVLRSNAPLAREFGTSYFFYYYSQP